MNAIRNWWRGYSDADVSALRTKLIVAHKHFWPGQFVPLNGREMKALQAGCAADL